MKGKVISSLLCFCMTVCICGSGIKAKSVTAEKMNHTENAEEVFEGMTLEEKIGQMIMAAARSWTDTEKNSTVLNAYQMKAIRDYNLTGLCLFSQNISDTEQTVKLTDQIQKAAFASAAGVGALIAVDQEGGYVTRLTTGTSGIGNMAIGAAGDISMAGEEAEIIGKELEALGINIDFAPDADVNSNMENPVIGIRSFSDDPKVVSENAESFLAGLEKTRVSGCLKHFPGHGDTDTDSHTGFPLINKSYEEMKQSDLIPFRDNVSNAEMIMTAHIQFPEIETNTYTSISTGEEVYLPATMSRTILTEILREDLGFQGVVVTDALEMDAIRTNFEMRDAARMIINAGADILLIPIDLNSKENIDALGEFIADIAEMVENGEIPEGEIDDSVKRILELKEAKGLLKKEERSLEERITSALAIVGCEENHAKEWEMACKTVTVYKNDGAFPFTEKEKENILYLPALESQLLSVEFAKMKLEEAGYNIGGMNITGMSYEKRSFDEIKKQIDSANVIILTTSCGALQQTDTSDPKNTQAIFCEKVIDAARKQNKKVIVISTRLPYDAEFYSSADAVLLCYNPSGMTELPKQYDGHVKKYGPNLPAALYTIFTA